MDSDQQFVNKELSLYETAGGAVELVLSDQLTPNTVDVLARGGLVLDYRDTWLIRNSTSLGSYSRTMPS